IKTEVEIPSLAVTIILDKSSSMSQQEKLDIAKDAAFSAIQVLKPLDTLGVLAFSDEPEWSVPPREVGDRRAIVDRLRSVGTGGSTALLAALEEAHRVMAMQTARVKHLILLSDGLSDTEDDFHSLVNEITADSITVSAVAFGDDADQTLMESIAGWGGGRYYYTKDPGNVPRIFTSETLVIARNLFVEEEVRPQLSYPGEMLKGFDPNGFPMLSGYQRVFAKPAAQVLLSASEEDPLLVSWRYGLGRSVAFSSDLAGRWGQQWVDWRDFGRFLAQAARWTMRRRGTERLLPYFRWSGQQAEIRVDALDRDDRFINGLEFEGSVADPTRSTSHFSLEQISPGRYRGEFAVPRAGRYYINLSGRAGDLRVGPTTFGLAVPYSAEYLSLGVNRDILADVADAAGGRLLPLGNASIPMVMASDADTPAHRGRVWWPVLLAALILLVLEIAVRKLVVPESWQLRWQRLRQRFSDASDSKPGDQELVADITRARDAHLNALQTQVRDHPDDPAARTRLYIVSGRKETRST
ncbi:MAG: VWA domain-containing protein, partial [Gammaproteobacteria bacterium]